MASESSFADQFPEDEFRQAIRDAMLMGMPDNPAERLRWRWDRNRGYVVADRIDVPYDLDATAVSDVPGNTVEDPDDDGLVVDYAVEAMDPTSGEVTTALGIMNAERLKVTLFDVDYEKIKDADYAEITTGTNVIRYEISGQAPPYGLFAVTMHDIFLQAADA